MRPNTWGFFFAEVSGEGYTGAYEFQMLPTIAGFVFDRSLLVAGGIEAQHCFHLY